MECLQASSPQRTSASGSPAAISRLQLDGQGRDGNDARHAFRLEPEEKIYVYYGIDSMGLAEQSKGKADGDSWVYTSEEMMGGKTFHGRYSMNTSSPDSYTFKYESSEDGQKWATVMEGKATKAAAAKKK